MVIRVTEVAECSLEACLQYVVGELLSIPTLEKHMKILLYVFSSKSQQGKLGSVILSYSYYVDLKHTCKLSTGNETSMVIRKSGNVYS